MDLRPGGLRVEITLTPAFTDGGRWDEDDVQANKRERILEVLRGLLDVESAEEVE